VVKIIFSVEEPRNLGQRFPGSHIAVDATREAIVGHLPKLLHVRRQFAVIFGHILFVGELW